MLQNQFWNDINLTIEYETDETIENDDYDIIISCTGFYKVKIVCHSIDYGILPIVIIVIMNKVLNGHGTHLPNLT